MSDDDPRFCLHVRRPISVRGGDVVTNPPFRLARAFVERALNVARPSMPPGEVIARGEKAKGGKTDFCWLVSHQGPAMIR
jgi:hypothetical protein